ncbi:hypothetical protein ACFWZ4_13310 [Frateuria sp. GZRe12]|uniref:hypothetical protein n=1 Tax=Frateuria sp. GZRe12 TaxID=3351533 RepID=UPI003EDB865B
MSLSETMLLQMRSVAIGGAGLCAAIILVVVQASTRSQPHLVALWAASIGTPVWLAAWQYLQPYIIQGSGSYPHYKATTAGLLGLAGMSSLFIALGSLVWLISPVAAGSFAIACLAAALFVSVHIRSVLAFVRRDGAPSA